MSLDTTISLTTADAVLAYLGTESESDGIWIYSDSSGATAATVEVTDTTIILKITGGADAGTNTLTFADADKDTIGELITAINALAGWKSGRIADDDAPSTDLVVTGALSCLGSANEQTLKIVDTALIEDLINRASDFLNRYCNRTLKTTTYTLQRYTAEKRKIYLDNYPVTAIAQISTGRIAAIYVKRTSTTAYNAYARVKSSSDEAIELVTDGTIDATIDISSGANDQLSEVVTAISAVSGWSASIVDSDYNSWPSSLLFEKHNVNCLNVNGELEVPDEVEEGYVTDLDAGIIELQSQPSRDFQDVFVSYTAGYTTIPTSLEQICIELVKLKYQMRKLNPGVKSEKIGRVYSYTLADLKKALPDDLLEQLDLFRSRLI